MCYQQRSLPRLVKAWGLTLSSTYVLHCLEPWVYLTYKLFYNLKEIIFIVVPNNKNNKLLACLFLENLNLKLIHMQTKTLAWGS